MCAPVEKLTAFHQMLSSNTMLRCRYVIPSSSIGTSVVLGVPLSPSDLLLGIKKHVRTKSCLWGAACLTVSYSDMLAFFTYTFSIYLLLVITTFSSLMRSTVRANPSAMISGFAKDQVRIRFHFLTARSVAGITRVSPLLSAGYNHDSVRIGYSIPMSISIAMRLSVCLAQSAGPGRPRC